MGVTTVSVTGGLPRWVGRRLVSVGPERLCRRTGRVGQGSGRPSAGRGPPGSSVPSGRQPGVGTGRPGLGLGAPRPTRRTRVPSSARREYPRFPVPVTPEPVLVGGLRGTGVGTSWGRKGPEVGVRSQPVVWPVVEGVWGRRAGRRPRRRQGRGPSPQGPVTGPGTPTTIALGVTWSGTGSSPGAGRSRTETDNKEVKEEKQGVAGPTVYTGWTPETGLPVTRRTRGFGSGKVEEATSVGDGTVPPR